MEATLIHNNKILQYSIPLFFFLLLPIFSNADNNSIGIVIASKLACREKPDINSKIIKYYHFSTPIHLINKSDSKSSIDKFNDYWYQDNETKGWLFGAYMILQNYNEDQVGIFEGKFLRCNWVCGGFSCFYIFEPILVSNYYIASFLLADYPQNETDPVHGVIIGKYSKTNNGIQFHNIEKIGAYSLNKKWIPFEELNISLKKSGFQDSKTKKVINLYDYYYKQLEYKFINIKDNNESIFINENEFQKFTSLVSILNKCKNDKSFVYSLTIYKYRRLTIPELHKYFPLFIKQHNF